MAFEKLFEHYLNEHKTPWCKIFHCAGVIILVAALLVALYTMEWKMAATGVVAWAVVTVSGHYFEDNKPVFLEHNLVYSIMCDFRMCWMICTGRIKIWS